MNLPMLPAWRLSSRSSLLALLPILLPRFGAAQAASGVSLSTSPNPSVFGAPVTLTATVTPASAVGNVTFFDGATILGTGVIHSGTASFTTVLLPTGKRRITACDPSYSTCSAARSSPVVQTVTSVPAGRFVPGPTLTADSAPTSITVGDFNGAAFPTSPWPTNSAAMSAFFWERWAAGFNGR